MNNEKYKTIKYYKYTTTLSGIIMFIYGLSIKYNYPCNILNCINSSTYTWQYAGILFFFFGFIFIILCKYTKLGNDEVKE